MKEDCLNELIGKANKLSPDEIKQLAEEVKGIIETAKIEGRDVDEVINKALAVKRTKIKNKKAEIFLAQKAYNTQRTLLEQFVDNPAQGIEAMIHTVVGKKYKGNGNIFRTRQSILDQTVVGFEQELHRHDGAFKRFGKGEMDRDIFRYIIDGTTEGMDASTVAVVKAYKKMLNNSYKLKREAGFNVGYLEDYVISEYHSAKQIRDMGKPEWVALARETYSYKKSGFESQAKFDEFLDGMWHKRVNSIGENFWAMGIDIDKFEIETRATPRKMERSRTLHYKDGEAAYNYARKMNRKPLADRMLNEIRRDAGKIAAAQHFGPNHKAVFLKTLAEAKAMAERQNLPFDETKLKRLYKLAVEGEDYVEQNLWAKIGDKSRKITNLAKLGTAVVTTLTDNAYGAGIISATTGKNFGGAMMEMMYESSKLFAKDLASAIPGLNIKSAQKELATKMGVFLEDVMALSATNRYADEATGSGWFDRFHNMGMRMSGLPLQARSARLAIAKIMSNGLAEAAEKNFDSLYPGMKEWFQRFGIDSDKWDIIRKGIDDFGDGTKGITPEAIHDLADDLFLAKGFDKKQISQLKTEMASSVGGFLTEIAEIGSPTPGLNVAELKGRLDPNTLTGQLLRFGMQFKSFTIAMWKTMNAIQKTGGHEKYGNYKGTAATIASATGLGYMVLALKDISKGREMRSPFDRETWVEAVVQGGAGAMIADFVLSDYTKNYRSIVKDLGGPVLSGPVEDLSVLASSIIYDSPLTKENAQWWDKKDTKRLINVMERNAPVNTFMPIIMPLMTKEIFRAMHNSLNTGKKYKTPSVFFD